MEKSSARNLDNAEPASADLMTLNNMIVNMRSVIKKSKVYTIRKLIQKVRRLKNKEDTIAKQNDLLDEIKIIKGLKCDKVSRYALGNTSSFSDVCKEEKISLDIKALARLTDCKAVKQSVQKFRSTHDDWRSLTLYLMVHQSGRRFHKQANQKKGVVKANRKVGDALLMNFINDKLTQEDGVCSLSDVQRAMKRPMDRITVSQNDLKTCNKEDVDVKSKRKKNTVTKIKSTDGNAEMDLEMTFDVAMGSKNTFDSTNVDVVQSTDVPVVGDDESFNGDISELEKSTIHGDLIVRRLNLSELNDISFDLQYTKYENKFPDHGSSSLRDNFFLGGDDCDSNEDTEEVTTSPADLDNSHQNSDDKYINKLKSTFVNTMSGQCSDIDVKKTKHSRNKKKQTDPHNKGTSKLKQCKSLNTASQPSVLDIHPSWEASRKRKEQLMSVKFEGKKVKFNDDD